LAPHFAPHFAPHLAPHFDAVGLGEHLAAPQAAMAGAADRAAAVTAAEARALDSVDESLLMVDSLERVEG
jgi:hypothetical protein